MQQHYTHLTKYFIYGLFLNFLLGWLGVGQLGAAASLAFGLICGPISGLSFGLSYILVVPLFSLYYVPTLQYLLYFLPEYGWPPDWYPSYSTGTIVFLVLSALSGIIYGYVPSQFYYSARRTLKRLSKGLVIAFILHIFITTIASLAAGSELNYREYMMYSSIASNVIPPLILGSLSAWICIMYLKQPSRVPPAYYPHRQPFHSSLRCPSCGFENSTTSAYCGKCGASLQHEETQVY